VFKLMFKSRIDEPVKRMAVKVVSCNVKRY